MNNNTIAGKWDQQAYEWLRKIDEDGQEWGLQDKLDSKRSGESSHH